MDDPIKQKTQHMKPPEQRKWLAEPVFLSHWTIMREEYDIRR